MVRTRLFLVALLTVPPAPFPAKFSPPFAPPLSSPFPFWRGGAGAVVCLFPCSPPGLPYGLKRASFFVGEGPLPVVSSAAGASWRCQLLEWAAITRNFTIGQMRGQGDQKIRLTQKRLNAERSWLAAQRTRGLLLLFWGTRLLGRKRSSQKVKGVMGGGGWRTLTLLLPLFPTLQSFVQILCPCLGRSGIADWDAWATATALLHALRVNIISRKGASIMMGGWWRLGHCHRANPRSWLRRVLLLT